MHQTSTDIHIVFVMLNDLKRIFSIGLQHITFKKTQIFERFNDMFSDFWKNKVY